MFDKKIVAIGDSHVEMFDGHGDWVHLNAPTAHNVYKHLEVIEKTLQKNAINILSFGEIDCRIHFWYQFNKSNNEHSLSELMHDTIHRFLCAISTIKIDYEIWTICVPPCGVQGNRFNYPNYATYPQHKMIYFAYNQILEELSKQYNYPFINYYFDVVDNSFDRLKEYVKDDCHLNNKIFPIICKKIEEELIKRGRD